jgi:transcription antitermination factor NusG
LGWGCAQTHGGAEAIATEHLGDQGFEVYCPRYVPPSRERDRNPVLYPLFPGYVFVMITPGRWWGSINNTRGVIRLLTTRGDGLGVPLTVTDEEMARVREHCPAIRRRGAADLRFAPNTIVRVRHAGNPFFEHVGTVAGMTKKQRVRVLMCLFNHETEVVFDYDDLVPADAVAAG